jgi:hypothetical protein
MRRFEELILNFLLALARRGRTDLAICVNNEGYAASLERFKVYRILPDPDATKHQQVRVVDESGEDYVYPAEYFELVTLPPSIIRRFREKAIA